MLRPFEIGEVPNDGQEPVIGDVESSELGGGGGGFFLLLRLPVGALLALALAAFLFGWALSGRLVALGGYHNSLRGGPDRLVFPFEDGLEGADVPFLPDRAQILRDEHDP